MDGGEPGLIEFIGPELTREIPPAAFPGNSAGTLIVLGLAIASAGYWRPRRCCTATACWPGPC